MTAPITLHVNGATITVDVDPVTPLLFVLRNDLGLKSPKLGCNQEQCHACAVLVDGTAVPSCKLPVEQVAGLAITTVEGLLQDDQLHPLQEAFVAEQAMQCGFCTAGMIIGAQGLLNRTRYPTDDEIRAALARHICRCGTYERVRRAIKLRVGRMEGPLYTVTPAPPLPAGWTDAPQPAMSPALAANPSIDDWIRIDEGGTISVFTGKVEIGQGILTALAQIAAEELDVALSRIRVIPADTEQSPDEGITAGSMSMQSSGTAIRQAAAGARQHLLRPAHEELEAATAPDELRVEDGTIRDPAGGRATDYWTLFSGRSFGLPVTGAGTPKDPADYRIVGQPITRLDLRDKVTGQPSYVHDLDLPGALHGRVVRPPGYGATLVDVDVSAVAARPGVVEIVRDGSFLAVLATREEQAIDAALALAAAARWDDTADLPPPATLFDQLRTGPAHSFLIRDGEASEEPIPPPLQPEDAASTLTATYRRPYQMHGSLGPSAAAAWLQDGKLTVWVQTQGVFPQQAALAQVLGMEVANVRVIHLDGSGCYGHNAAEDAAMDAALLAVRVPGQPVSLKWTRADEHRWEPYGPAMVLHLQASLAEDGRIGAWNHDVWSYPHANRPRAHPTTSGMLAARHLAEPFPIQQPQARPGREFGEYRNADPAYVLPARRVASHVVLESPLRTSALRSLGAFANVFAIESFMDELAHAAGVDPVAFRLNHLENPRARAVIEAVAARSDWGTYTDRSAGRGQGIGFAQYKNSQCYAAVVVELTVDPTTRALQLDRIVIAADAGQVVNPDGLSNQLEGGALQAASWTLHEAVQFDSHGILSTDWDSYPVLRFPGAPRVETALLNRPELPFLGSGEATQGPTSAAIANAIFAATGRRLRDLPLAPNGTLRS